MLFKSYRYFVNPIDDYTHRHTHHISVHVHTHSHAPHCTCTYARICTLTQTHSQTRILACTHTHIHTHIHRHTHTHFQTLPPLSLAMIHSPLQGPPASCSTPAWLRQSSPQSPRRASAAGHWRPQPSIATCPPCPHS